MSLRFDRSVVMPANMLVPSDVLSQPDSYKNDHRELLSFSGKSSNSEDIEYEPACKFPHPPFNTGRLTVYTEPV